MVSEEVKVGRKTVKWVPISPSSTKGVAVLVSRGRVVTGVLEMLCDYIVLTEGRRLFK